MPDMQEVLMQNVNALAEAGHPAANRTSVSWYGIPAPLPLSGELMSHELRPQLIDPID